MNEALKFKAWLKLNARHLRAYAPDEIAYLARLNGFDLALVCSGVSDLHAHISRMMAFWESPLSDQWLDLVSYNSKGYLQGEN